MKDYRKAVNPAHAVELMHQGPGKGKYTARSKGELPEGSDLEFVVDISEAGLDNVARSGDGALFIGAAATLENLAGDELVKGFAGGVLSQTAAWYEARTGAAGNTVGGNLCGALPTAAMAPVLLCLDAVCFVMDHEEQESLALADFFVGPGLTVLEGRLLLGVALPAEADSWRCCCQTWTQEVDEEPAGQVAVSLAVDDETISEARIALAGAGPVPARCQLAEGLLTGRPLKETTSEVLAEVVEMVVGEMEPIKDSSGSDESCQDKVRDLTRQLLTMAVAGKK